MKPQRLDKIIASQGTLSRKDAASYIWRGRVSVNGEVVKKIDYKVDTDADIIRIDGTPLSYQKYIYLMLNKPKGVVSAASDKNATTVVDLVPAMWQRNGLFPAGRLDKDSEGFVLITDDGTFAHNILSPKRHVDKTYQVEVDGPVPPQVVEAFQEGVTLHDGERCLQAQLTVLTQSETKSVVQVVLREGMYHQIKRMFGVYGLGVNALKRTHIGSLPLDESLSEGKCREITPQELLQITQSI